ncbi:unnamed protein product [Moneuplotes crassus]|uniref:Peptidase S26 domain-containing protein n=1 Tax=Euplotes crassus TaxID=5936 RepID=A0AAD1XRI0_EUPCR|nr:unnamed protein product [Moneuplotes crassus]
MDRIRQMITQAKKGGKHIWFTTCMIVQLGAFFVLSEKYLFSIIGVKGPSMEPVLGARDNIVFVNLFKWKILGQLKRNDVIVAVNPFKPGYQIVKRVLYMSGETAKFKKNDGEYEYVKIPPNHIWVEGDNKKNSRDSRNFGPLSLNLVEGIATRRVWPRHSIL